MNINGTTATYGIIGWPVEHSLSPVFQNRFIQTGNINAVYVPFAVAPELLKQAMQGLYALGVEGFNVTVPHKESVFAMLDADGDAKKIGAVNTVRRTADESENTVEKSNSGFNTEYPGDGKKEGEPKMTSPSAEEELQLKHDELNDKYIRLYSEFDNFKRRTIKERIELFKSASEDIVTTLLPVLDDFDRVSNNESEDIKVLKEAIKLIHNKIKNTLVKKGLEDMDSMKKKFDTDLHDAITNVPAPSKKLKGKVVDVIEKGYLLNGKVIRYAKVVVGN